MNRNQTMKVVLIEDEKPKREYKHRIISDSELIAEGSRPPKYIQPVFYPADQLSRSKWRSELYSHKRAFKETKRLRPDVYRSNQENLIREFLKSNTPDWGGFKFQGVKV